MNQVDSFHHVQHHSLNGGGIVDIAECDTLEEALNEMEPPDRVEAIIELEDDGLFQQYPIERVGIG